MGSFRYSNIFSYIFELNKSPDILKVKNEVKKYFLEWGSNPQKYYLVAIYLQGRNRKIFRSNLVQMKLAKSPFEIN